MEGCTSSLCAGIGQHPKRFRPQIRKSYAFSTACLPIRALTHSMTKKVIHHVDVSWNQAFTKTDLIRFYKLANGILTITAAPAIDPYSGKEVVHQMEFRKV